MRKLVTKRYIDEIREHSNADALELAIIDGWQVITRKGEFKVGDPCVFFEIDSFLPADDPRFEFLVKGGTKKDPSDRERIRLKTMKLRQELSQGLALPWPIFPELHAVDPLEGDMDGVLDVIKYERPEPQAANAAGNFPEYLRKTDEERIQNLWNKWKDKYADVEFIPTLKLDGSSCTLAFLGEDMDEYWHGATEEGEEEKALEVLADDVKVGEIVLCSRNLQLKYNPDSHFWKSVEGIIPALYDMYETLGFSFAIQGEVMGPGVQGNKEKFINYRFFAFNLWDISNQEFIEYQIATQIFDMFEIDQVPQYEPLKPFSDFATMDELLEYADGPSINAKHREGIVFKSVWEDENVSFKCISNQFLLKVED